MRSPQEAFEEIISACAPLPGEQVELGAALGRVLVRPVVAARLLPPWDNSAMDGYAVRAEEADGPLRVVGIIAAGQVAEAPLGAGEAYRIMTGAPLPEGADAVVMQEEAEEAGDVVRFRLPPAAGDHVRRAGEDVRPGQEVLPAGAAVGPGEIGLLAALGRTLCEVHRRPLVAIVSTGDELVRADEVPGPGQIVGSNAHALAAQVREAGGVPWVLPFCRDDRAALREALTRALRADVVLSSGGVSVGAFDYVKEVLSEVGVRERFWQVAMKPGKPLTFGMAEGGRTAPPGQRSSPAGTAPPGQRSSPAGTLCFGLPGNPASSMVSFELFVRPALLRLLGHGQAALRRPVCPARLASPLQPDRRRPHFVRALCERERGAAVLWARPGGLQGSGMLRSMTGINALLEIAPGEAPLPAGAEVPAHLLSLV